MYRLENLHYIEQQHSHILCVYTHIYIGMVCAKCSSAVLPYLLNTQNSLHFLSSQGNKGWSAELPNPSSQPSCLLTYSINSCEKAGTAVRRFSTLALSWQDMSSLSSLHFVTLTFSLLSHHNYLALEKKGADYLWVRYRIWRTKRVLEIYSVWQLVDEL